MNSRNKDFKYNLGFCACKIDRENLSFEVATSQPQNYLTSPSPADMEIKPRDFWYVFSVQEKSLMSHSEAVSVVQQWVLCITYSAYFKFWNLGRSRPYRDVDEHGPASRVFLMKMASTKQIYGGNPQESWLQSKSRFPGETWFAYVWRDDVSRIALLIANNMLCLACEGQNAC